MLHKYKLKHIIRLLVAVLLGTNADPVLWEVECGVCGQRLAIVLDGGGVRDQLRRHRVSMGDD